MMACERTFKGILLKNRNIKKERQTEGKRTKIIYELPKVAYIRG